MTIEQKITWFVIAGITAICAMLLASPDADASPEMTGPPCVGAKPSGQWYDPCTATNPPWYNPPNVWQPTPVPGTWGPNGYTACTYDRKCG